MISEVAMGRAGAGDLIFHSLFGPEERKKALDVSGPSSIDCKYFGGRIRSSEAAMGGGGGVRSTLSGVAVNPVRRVRAAHGRAREAKTH